MFGKQNYQAVELVELSPTSVLWFLKGQLVFSISLQNNSSWIGVCYRVFHIGPIIYGRNRKGGTINIFSILDVQYIIILTLMELLIFFNHSYLT
jgi:hypothetical protein